MVARHTRKDGVPKRFRHLYCFQASIISFLLLLLLIFFGSARALSEALPFVINWQDGHLSVTAEGIPLSSILQEISFKTGLEIRGSDDLKESIYMNFSGLTLSRGLKRLLARVNYSIVEKETSSYDETAPVLVLIIGEKGAHERIKTEDGLLRSELQREENLLSSGLQKEEELLISELQRSEEELLILHGTIHVQQGKHLQE